MPMNVTEFAEQIVFGKTLEDKLVAPGRLTPTGTFEIAPMFVRWSRRAGQLV